MNDGHGGHSQGSASFGNPGGMHEHHGGGTGGGRGGQATREAANFAHNHGPNSRAHFTNSGISHAHAQQAGVNEDAAIDRQGGPPPIITYEQSVTNCKEPTRSLLLHVTNHAHFDMHGQLTKLAGKRKMVRLDRCLPNRDGVAEHIEKGMEKCPSGIMAWHAWVPSMNPADMPSGWAEGFTGETWLAKQYWGIAKWDTKAKCWGYDPDAKTFIEVAYTVWRFFETGCFETKMTMRVISSYIYYPPAGKYAYKISSFKAAQAAMLGIVEELFAGLKKAVPQGLEAGLLARFGQNTGAHLDGAYPTPRDDQAELTESDLNADVQEDENTASDSSSTIEGGLTPPVDTPVEPPTSFPDDMALVDHSGADLANVLPSGARFAAVAATQNPPATPPAAKLVEVTVNFPKQRN